MFSCQILFSLTSITPFFLGKTDSMNNGNIGSTVKKCALGVLGAVGGLFVLSHINISLEAIGAASIAYLGFDNLASESTKQSARRSFDNMKTKLLK